jgi:hypothetical protein
MKKEVFTTEPVLPFEHTIHWSTAIFHLVQPDIVMMVLVGSFV